MSNELSAHTVIMIMYMVLLLCPRDPTKKDPTKKEAKTSALTGQRPGIGQKVKGGT